MAHCRGPVKGITLSKRCRADAEALRLHSRSPHKPQRTRRRRPSDAGDSDGGEGEPSGDQATFWVRLPGPCWQMRCSAFWGALLHSATSGDRCRACFGQQLPACLRPPACHLLSPLVHTSVKMEKNRSAAPAAHVECHGTAACDPLSQASPQACTLQVGRDCVQRVMARLLLLHWTCNFTDRWQHASRPAKAVRAGAALS